MLRLSSHWLLNRHCPLLIASGLWLRSLTVNEAGAKGLDAEPKGIEWMAAVLIAQVCSFSAQLECQAIAPPYPGRIGTSKSRWKPGITSPAWNRTPGSCLRRRKVIGG